MKRKIVAASAITFAVVLAFCSCQSSPVVWDDTIPEHQLATVLFSNMTIETYNGIAVTKFTNVKIPAGETKLSGTVNVRRGDLTFVAKSMEWAFNFEAGKTYTMLGAARDMRWGILVFDTVQYSELNKEHEIAFVPFKEQPKFN